MTKDTSGPAFPHSRLGSDADGMTLRDWFAGMAMQGLCAGDSTNAQTIAKAAYIVADAMLAARQA